MGVPVAKVEVAFSTDPGSSTPSWTDLTARVRGFSSRRGRQTELDRIEAGTASVVFDNRDRALDPTYASSAYWPNVIPTRRIRISATFNAVTYRLFTGYVNAWPPEWPGPADATVTVQCTDGFMPLKLDAPATVTYSQQLSGARITAILDGLGWPAAERAIDTGQSQVQGVTLTKAARLQHAQDVAVSEAGLFFCRADGYAVFQDRAKRSTAPYDTSQATFGDGGAGELPYVEIALSSDDAQLWNQIIASRNGGTDQVANDSTSQGRHFTRTETLSLPLVTTDVELADAAAYRLQRSKTPYTRVDSLLLNGEADDALWPHLLGREISDRITVRKRPVGGGAAIERVAHIEAIEHQFAAEGGLWGHRWSLSPADLTSYWVLDSATNSVLGSTTRVGY